jgi:hypothetical protein
MTRSDIRNGYTSRADFSALKRLLSAEAQRLREESGSIAPPYNPESVADFLGVRVEDRQMTGPDGFVEVREGKYVAVISTKTHPTRQRFTLAHELGHVLFMKLEEKGTCMPLKRYRMKQNTTAVHQDPVEESLCNYFASELLLPLSDVKKRLNNRSIGPRTITGLAEDFYVSKQAAAVKVFKCEQDLKACSLWSLDSLWPMPVWWTGKKSRRASEMEALESLVGGAREERTEIWDSYNEGNERVKIMVSPAGLRFAMVLIVAIGPGRFIRV